MRKRCWNAKIGKVSKRLCNTDSISKRKVVQSEVYKQLDRCEDASINGSIHRHVDADRVQYGVQSGSIKEVRCARVKMNRKCRQVRIEDDSLQVCDNDPLNKKIDVMDVVDEVLSGCKRGARVIESGGNSYVVRRKGGIDAKQRNAIARDVIAARVTHVGCLNKKGK